MCWERGVRARVLPCAIPFRAGILSLKMAPLGLDRGARQRSKLTQDIPIDAVGVARETPGMTGSLRPCKPPRHSAHTARTPTDRPAAESDCADGISVALEWKLLFPLLARGANDPQPDDKRRVVAALCENDEQACLVQGHECIAQTIRESGEKAITAHGISNMGLKEKDFWDSAWIVKKANSAEPLDREKSLEGYIWVSVEICSPRMRAKDPRTRARMLKVLDALISSHRLAANCTCEVHVHLGRMDGRPWSLSTLKRLGTLLWVAEPTLRSIRDPNSPNFHNTHTWGFEMRKHSRLAGKVGSLSAFAGQCRLAKTPSAVIGAAIPDEHVFDAMRAQRAIPTREFAAVSEIWMANSILDLGRLLSGSEKKYRRLGFNFSAFGEEDERARRNPRTVEFRIMEGSVAADLILSWLAICCTIAEVAVTRSSANFAAALSWSLLQRAADYHQPARDLGEAPGARRARHFRELMQALAVPEADYGAFEEKIEREY